MATDIDERRRRIVAHLRAHPEDRPRILEQLGRLDAGGGVSEAEALRYWWPAWARPGQLMPEGDWKTLFLCCGRGGGKTKTGAELTIEAVRDHDVGGYVALIAPTYSDIDAVMVHGDSGIRACSPPWFMPKWKPGGSYGGELHWPPSPGCMRGPSDLGGVIGYCFTAEKPEQIRGPQFGWYWGDEIAKWDLNGGDSLLVQSNIEFAHRLGRFRRGVFTSTPKPTPLVCQLDDEDRCEREEIEAGKRRPDRRVTIMRRWSTHENAANLGRDFVQRLEDRYGGTTKGREELEAEIIRDDPGAMWSSAMIDAAQVSARDVPELSLIVVAVDNATTKAKPGEIDASTVESRNRNVGANDTGIIVAGLGGDGLFYVLGDYSVNGTPHEWGSRVLGAFAHAWDGREANVVVAEKNQGGDLIAANIDVALRNHGISPDRVPIYMVTASDGKEARAEPIVSLYQQGRVKHAARLADLEFQQTRYKRGQRRYKKDRVDALVWALTYLIESSTPGQGSRWSAYSRR